MLIAAIVVSIQRKVLYVKPLTVLVRGSSMSKAEVIPVKTDEATRKLARYKYLSLIISTIIIANHCLLAIGVFSPGSFDSLPVWSDRLLQALSGVSLLPPGWQAMGVVLVGSDDSWSYAAIVAKYQPKSKLEK